MDYEKLYNTYYMQVYSYAIALTKNPELAEEITQNTFYKALSTKARFAGRSDELTWLCAIAKNLHYDEVRRNQRLTGEDEITHISSDADLEQTMADADMAFRIHLVLHELEINGRRRIRRRLLLFSAFFWELVFSKSLEDRLPQAS